MDINDSNLQQLAGYLQKTLAHDPVERRGAERFLESIEGNQNYPILLLHVIDKADVSMHLRISASITLKNYIKRNWKITEEVGDKIHTNDRAMIKESIVGLMLRSPDQIQKQLSDAISYIGREDFPEKWPNLLTEMIEKFQTGDFHIINGVLHTAHSIFKRYRHEFKSEKLWREIKFVLDKFAIPFTELSKATMELARVHENHAEALKIIYSSLVLICKIFYSLNFQDLPEFFEDNMATWMDHFHILLTTDNELLCTEDKEEAGLMEQVKTQICDNLTMYAQKYDEEFSPHLPNFVTDIWNLLIHTGVEVKYDLLVSNAIQFLASVAERPGYKQLFENPGTLSSICEKVIVPNMEFRDADEEAFEDNAEDYIRRDIEGSDIDTRRRAACDLVRALSRSFEDTVIQNFSVYVRHMLEIYQKDPIKNWKSKDAAIFLVTSLAAKAQTQKHGITQTSQLVNVSEFFTNHIAPDLQTANDANGNPVLKADAIKYIMVFRNQLPRDVLVACLRPLVDLITSTSQVVHSYSACCIEKLLTVKGANGELAIGKSDLAAYSEPLLTNLFMALNMPGSHENEYIMKGIMRTLHLLQEVFVPFVGTIVTQLTDKLIVVCKNPSKPHFNHYLFECLCVTISVTCKANSAAVPSFEEKLFPLFQGILQQDVQEFVPYVFQVLSLLLELHVSNVSDPYMALFPHLLQPVLWERPGNIPPLVRLLQAYIRIGMQQISADKLPALLGIFQKLLASKSNDHFGFQLLNSLLVHVPQNTMQPFLNQVFILIFQRLSSSKTTKYVKCVLVFFSLYAIKYSAVALVSLIDGIQAKMFGMVMEKIFIADVQKVSGMADRKICAVGMTKILTKVPAVIKPDYDRMWPLMLQALIALLELPMDSTATMDESTSLDINESEGFQTAYSQLVYGGKHEIDYCADVPDVKINLARSLQVLSKSSPDIKLLISRLPADALSFLQQYITTAGVTIG